MSSACLNDSDEQLFIFRNSDGKVLKINDGFPKKKVFMDMSVGEGGGEDYTWFF